MVIGWDLNYYGNIGLGFFVRVFFERCLIEVIIIISKVYDFILKIEVLE